MNVLVGNMRPAIRICALWLALAGLFTVTVALASPAHDHANTPANTCTLCMAAHLPAVQAGSPHTFFELEYRGRAALPLIVTSYSPLFSSASFTRGPPSL